MKKTLLGERGGRLRVWALTAIRSEYDLLFPLLKALDADPRFEVGVIAAGAHLTSLHRRSVRLIEADGFKIVARLPNLEAADTTAARVRSCGRLLQGLGKLFERTRPDLLIVLGDREEPLIAATAAGYLSIPVVHVAGGDSTLPRGGDVDEAARHATTKLSHVHLTMAQAHSRRVLRLGEEPWRVKTVGNPGLDRFRLEPPLGREELAGIVGPAARGDYAVLIYHALSSAAAQAPAEAALCLKACLAAELDVFVGAPNSDPGYRAVVRALGREKSSRVHFYGNLPRRPFAALLRHARCLVGNSSLGILEAPFLGLPCVNVGERQRGRLAGINVQFVPARAADVLRAVRKAARDAAYRARVKAARGPYGDGRMADKAVRFLAGLPSKNVLLDKRITY